MVLFLVRFLSQCTEYFDLRCQLLDDLTSEWMNFPTHYQYPDTKILNVLFSACCSVCASASEMEVINVSPANMLEDEISWLDNFEPSWSSEMETSEADNVLLAGHLRLIKTLLSLCGNEKEHLGEYINRSMRTRLH